MAQAYINGGPEKGNLSMGEFDRAAETINNEADAFKNESQVDVQRDINQRDINTINNSMK